MITSRVLAAIVVSCLGLGATPVYAQHAEKEPVAVTFAKASGGSRSVQPESWVRDIYSRSERALAHGTSAPKFMLSNFSERRGLDLSESRLADLLTLQAPRYFSVTTNTVLGVYGEPIAELFDGEWKQSDDASEEQANVDIGGKRFAELVAEQKEAAPWLTEVSRALTFDVRLEYRGNVTDYRAVAYVFDEKDAHRIVVQDIVFPAVNKIAGTDKFLLSSTDEYREAVDAVAELRASLAKQDAVDGAKAGPGGHPPIELCAPASPDPFTLSLPLQRGTLEHRTKGHVLESNLQGKCELGVICASSCTGVVATVSKCGEESNFALITSLANGTVHRFSSGQTAAQSSGYGLGQVGVCSAAAVCSVESCVPGACGGGSISFGGSVEPGGGVIPFKLGGNGQLTYNVRGARALQTMAASADYTCPAPILAQTIAAPFPQPLPPQPKLPPWPPGEAASHGFSVRRLNGTSTVCGTIIAVAPDGTIYVWLHC